MATSPRPVTGLGAIQQRGSIKRAGKNSTHPRDQTMASELKIRAELDTMRSLPLRLARLANSISKTDWPGQKTRLSLPAELMLTETERAEMEQRLAAINGIITGSNLNTAECS